MKGSGNSSALCCYTFNSANISQVFAYFWLLTEMNLNGLCLQETKGWVESLTIVVFNYRVLLPRGHVAMSEHILFVTVGGAGCSSHVVTRAQGCC